MKTYLSKLEPIGLIFFIVGSLFYFMHWPFGIVHLTIAIGLISIGILLDTHKSKDPYVFGSNYALVVFVISSLFWIASIPGSGAMKAIGITSLAVYFMFRLFMAFKIENYFNRNVAVFMNSTFIFTCISFVFIYEHWPFRIVILIFTFLLFGLFSALLYIYSIGNTNYKEATISMNPRKVTFLSIGLIIVFFNLFNKLPFSTQLCSFNQCKIVQNDKMNLLQQGDAYFNTFTDSSDLKIATQINDLTLNQLSEIQELKLAMLHQSQNDTIYHFKKRAGKVIDLDINFEYLQNSFNYDIPNYVFNYTQSNGEIKKGDQLYNHLKELKTKLENLLQTSSEMQLKDKNQMVDSNRLIQRKLQLQAVSSSFYFLNTVNTFEFTDRNWSTFNFDHLILINTLEKIMNIERKIVKTRLEAFVYLSNN